MSRSTPILCSLLAALCFLFIPCAPAHAFFEKENERGDTSIEMLGAVRITGAFLHFPDIYLLHGAGDDGLSAAVARLLVSGDLGQRVKYEVNLHGELSRSPSMSFGGGAFATAGTFVSPYRNQYLSWDYWQDGAVAGQLGVDRLMFKFFFSSVEIHLGRMPINYSATQIFTPNDFFAPFSTTAVNKIYKPGVDALKVSWAAGTISSVELSGVLGSDEDGVPSWGNSALLLRASTVLWDTQWALLGGKLAGRWVVGFSLQGEVGLLGVRAEGHVGFPDAEGDGLDEDLGTKKIHGRLAAGVDRKFVWQNATVGFEAMYLSDGATWSGGYTRRLAGLYPDEVPYMASLYLGLSGGLELIPILRAGAMVLVNTQDGSGMAALTLMYNIADEADFVGGVLAPWGEAPEDAAAGALKLKSEYGLYPLMVFLESRFYF